MLSNCIDCVERSLQEGRRTIWTHIGVNAAGVTRVRTPQYLTCRVPSMCWTPEIIPTQSRVRCTVFVNIIDFVVSAVVEQVYSSTFKFCLLKYKKSVPSNASFLPLNAPMHQNAFGRRAPPGPDGGAYSFPS